MNKQILIKSFIKKFNSKKIFNKCILFLTILAFSFNNIVYAAGGIDTLRPPMVFAPRILTQLTPDAKLEKADRGIRLNFSPSEEKPVSVTPTWKTAGWEVRYAQLAPGAKVKLDTSNGRENYINVITGELTNINRNAFAPAKQIRNVLVKEDYIQAGKDGAIIALMVKTKDTLSVINEVSQAKIEGEMQDAFDWKKFEEFKYGDHFVGLPFYNLKAMEIVNGKNEYVGLIQMWLAGKGVDCGYHDHTGQKICEVHFGMVNGTGTGGMVYYNEKGEEVYLTVNPGEAHGPFWEINLKTGKAILREDGSVKYGQHKWQGGGERVKQGEKDSFDLWMVIEIDPAHAVIKDLKQLEELRRSASITKDNAFASVNKADELNPAEAVGAILEGNGNKSMGRRDALKVLGAAFGTMFLAYCGADKKEFYSDESTDEIFNIAKAFKRKMGGSYVNKIIAALVFTVRQTGKDVDTVFNTFEALKKKAKDSYSEEAIAMLTFIALQTESDVEKVFNTAEEFKSKAGWLFFNEESIVINTFTALKTGNNAGIVSYAAKALRKKAGHWNYSNVAIDILVFTALQTGNDSDIVCKIAELLRKKGKYAYNNESVAILTFIALQTGNSVDVVFNAAEALREKMNFSIINEPVAIFTFAVLQQGGDVDMIANIYEAIKDKTDYYYTGRASIMFTLAHDKFLRNSL